MNRTSHSVPNRTASKEMDIRIGRLDGLHLVQGAGLLPEGGEDDDLLPQGRRARAVIFAHRCRRGAVTASRPRQASSVSTRRQK